MNRKSEELNHIIDTVLHCCQTKVSDDGPVPFSREDVMGASRSAPLVMTRCLLASHLLAAGYSVATIASVMQKTTAGIRNLLRLGQTYHRTSRAYRIAEEEANDLLSQSNANQGL